MTYVLTEIEFMFKIPGLTLNYSKVEYKIFELSFMAYYIYYVWVVPITLKNPILIGSY